MGGSSGGGGGSSSGGTYTMRYAPYIEDRHQVFLNDTYNLRLSAASQSPYITLTEIPVDTGFFGIGYALASFPAMFDMYGKFIAGLDIEALWEQIMRSTIDSPQADNLVAAESALLDDELDSSILPKFMTGMRDLNSVMSSTFVIGKGLLIDTKQKLVAKFSAELKWKLVAVAQDRYKAHMAWNIEVVNSYAKMFELYYSSKDRITRLNFELGTKAILWPLDVMDYERANLGALQGAMKQTSDKGGGSSGGSFLGGAFSGAAAGGMLSGGNPLGMLAGGVLGGVASLF